MRRLSAQSVRVLDALAADAAGWHHGYDLARTTELASGTLYPILVRLADRGLLEARWDDAARPGPRRHLYRVTAAGLAAARRVPAAGAAARRLSV
jgi:PadR family transcriptional regulator